jgi:peptide/nickel transport system substrate-binding protein
MMRRLSVVLVVLMVLLSVLAACGGAAAPAAAGQIVIAIGGDPSTLDPQAADDGNERAVNENIYETLVARDPKTMELVPNLAESWKELDATTWEFKLRQGIKFHNGELFNANAAAFSINRVIDPNFKSELISYFSTIKEARVVDDNTIHVITTGPDPTVPARLYFLKMVPPVYSADANFGTKPVGTGPYKFVEWIRDDHVTLEANLDYWGATKPSIAKVTIRPIKEEVTRLAALKAGEVDLVRGLIPEYVNEVPKAVSTPGLEFPWLRLNCLVGPLADKRLRQAINYAIDKEALAQSLYSGYAVPADGQLLTPAHFGYNPNVKAYPFDQAKAKALIQEAGYAGAEIEFIGEAGRWLKDKELIEAVAQQLREVGFNVKVNIVEWSQWLDLLFAGADKAPMIQFSAHGNELLDADRTLSAIFESTGSQTAYKNPEFDALVEAARIETDTTKRADDYHQAVQIAYDDAVIGFLLNLKDIYGMTNRVEWTPRLDGKMLVVEMRLTK